MLSAEQKGAGEAGFVARELQLRDGRCVTVRAISANDKEGLQAALQRLSAESRYSRFMAPLRELSPKMLERATTLDPRRELGLVAVVGDGAAEKIVAGARFVAASGSDECEFAVTIADDWQGRGLARQLMELLLDNAATRGFRVMEGFILASNTAMRNLAQRLGFDDRPMADDPTVRIVRRAL